MPQNEKKKYPFYKHITLQKGYLFMNHTISDELALFSQELYQHLNPRYLRSSTNYLKIVGIPITIIHIRKKLNNMVILVKVPTNTWS